jgi:hypothetical protein
MTELKRIGPGAALIAAPLALLVGFAIHPAEKSDALGEVQVLAANTARWNLAHLLLLIGAALLVPAAFGLAQRLAVRGRAATIGVLLVGAGSYGVAALMGAEFAMANVGGLAPAERTGAAPLIHRIYNMDGLVAVGWAGMLLIVGLLVLGVLLVRHGTAPRWASALVVAGSLLLGGGFVNPVAGAVACAVLVLGLGAHGIDTLRDGQIATVQAPHPTFTAAGNP